jgi:hypothetical protein
VLLADTDDEPLPELAMAVVEHRRREGVGTALSRSWTGRLRSA